MTKKALVNTNESKGQDNRGYRVLEVVDSGNEFEVHSSMEWKDCPDSIESYDYWYDPTTNTFRILPDAVHQSTAGALAEDAEGNLIEDYQWDWTTDTWTKVSV